MVVQNKITYIVIENSSLAVEITPLEQLGEIILVADVEGRLEHVALAIHHFDLRVVV